MTRRPTQHQPCASIESPPSDLPEGWIQKMIGEIAKTSSGGTPSRGRSDYYGGTIPWVKSGELGDGVVIETSETITGLGLNSSSAKVFPKGTVCIALYGATVGKVGILGMDAATNQAVCGIFLPEFIDTKYMFRYLQSIRQQLIELGKGGAQPNISQEIVRQTIIPLPPLAEQKRIVAKVEELLARVNEARERLVEVTAILKRFRQSILAAACSGRLTEDWRVTNPFMKDGDGENGHGDLPIGWCRRPLRELCCRFQYGSSQKSQAAGEVPVLRMGNIQNGKIDWNNLAYTNDQTEIDRYLLKPQTVLFNRTNSPELVGKTGIYQGERPAVFAGYLIAIQHGVELDPTYMNYCLNTSEFRYYRQMVKTDGVSQSNINAQKLAAYAIPWCPQSEQNEIVKRVDCLFALADNVERQVNKGAARADKLTQAVLAKAFRGELVQQDLNDEPVVNCALYNCIHKPKDMS